MNKRILPITPWSNTSYWAIKVKPLTMLCVSLSLIGFGEALLLKSQLGSAPWTVFAQGLAVQTGLNIGFLIFVISCGVLVLWLPLKQRFGLGTILNISIIALTVGVLDVWLPTVDDLIWKIIWSVIGVIIVGIASALYLTSHMGAGPRDGLMVGLAQRTGLKIGIIRTFLEGLVCLTGWFLGGVVGLATLLFAFGVGAVLQISLGVLFKIYHQLHIKNSIPQTTPTQNPH